MLSFAVMGVLLVVSVSTLVVDCWYSVVCWLLSLSVDDCRVYLIGGSKYHNLIKYWSLFKSLSLEHPTCVINWSFGPKDSTALQTANASLHCLMKIQFKQEMLYVMTNLMYTPRESYSHRFLQICLFVLSLYTVGCEIAYMYVSKLLSYESTVIIVQGKVKWIG